MMFAYFHSINIIRLPPTAASNNPLSIISLISVALLTASKIALSSNFPSSSSSKPEKPLLPKYKVSFVEAGSAAVSVPSATPFK